MFNYNNNTPTSWRGRLVMEITSCPCPWLSSGGRDIGFGQHDVFDSYQLKNVWQDATSSSDIRINIQNICRDPYERAVVSMKLVSKRVGSNYSFYWFCQNSHNFVFEARYSKYLFFDFPFHCVGKREGFKSCTFIIVKM